MAGDIQTRERLGGLLKFCYTGGHVLCYLDGVQVLDASNVQGDFSNWTPHHLVFEDEWSGERNWSGTLECVAVFSRALSPEEVKRDVSDTFEDNFAAILYYDSAI